MKKTICFLVSLLILTCCLAGCNIEGNLGDQSLKSGPQVEQMLTALSDRDMDGALALIHPDRMGSKQEMQAMLQQMMDFLNGRRFRDLHQQGISVESSFGTAGTSREESATIILTLEDDTVCKLIMTHLTRNKTSGFISFQLVLGVE